jgi:hypothetical protein
MVRRLYLTFPASSQARRAVADLQGAGVRPEHMHAVGDRFAVRLPHAHLADLRVPLEHGEVVLLVDVPLYRVREIEHPVAERHPEVGVGGVGWTVEAFGV